ncbi:MAG: hypothetical protein O3A51_08015, partial [Verrucomicrobia bacterium]|nr:hypothetical protein [Verrucomicrobiota bacterium]
VNFYRSQQGGGAPARVLLTGGASIMPYTDTFFEEKLKVPVEYLNPFAAVTVGPGIDEERINEHVHLMGEVVGLALRHGVKCPIELNLMPPDLVAIKTFRKRQPFFAGATVALLAALLAFWGYTSRLHDVRRQQLAEVESKINELQGVQQRLSAELAAKAAILTKITDIRDVVQRRTAWTEALEAIHSCLLEGMWITGIQPNVAPDGTVASLLLNGKGFNDRLKRYGSESVTPIELFRDRLRESPYFSEGTDIKTQRPPGPGDYDQDFTMRLELATPFKTR